VEEFIEANWLRPHKSQITGEHIVMLRDVYNIPILATLVVLGAETSLGDLTGLGGKLAERCNYGCIRASVKGPWQHTADGTVIVRDVEWWTWPDPLTGMDAWGQYFADRFDGAYLDAVAKSDWRGLAAVYYGRHVAGYAEYASSLEARAANIRAKAKKAGYEW
jgi:hypothetical protein